MTGILAFLFSLFSVWGSAEPARSDCEGLCWNLAARRLGEQPHAGSYSAGQFSSSFGSFAQPCTQWLHKADYKLQRIPEGAKSDAGANEPREPLIPVTEWDKLGKAWTTQIQAHQAAESLPWEPGVIIRPIQRGPGTLGARRPPRSGVPACPRQWGPRGPGARGGQCACTHGVGEICAPTCPCHIGRDTGEKARRRPPSVQAARNVCPPSVQTALPCLCPGVAAGPEGPPAADTQLQGSLCALSLPVPFPIGSPGDRVRAGAAARGPVRVGQVMGPPLGRALDSAGRLCCECDSGAGGGRAGPLGENRGRPGGLGLEDRSGAAGGGGRGPQTRTNEAGEPASGEEAQGWSWHAGVLGGGGRPPARARCRAVSAGEPGAGVRAWGPDRGPPRALPLAARRTWLRPGVPAGRARAGRSRRRSFV